MRFSYRWLLEYLQTRRSLQEVLHGFTMAGLEVETVTDLGAISGKIVVGQILEVHDHPDADTLHVCTVDVGEDRSLNIVCGAHNMKQGDNVAVALEGASLSGGLEIRRTRIRGQVSEGMICAGDELGLNEDHEGVLILPKEWKIGEPMDAIIDIAVTPNRGDCLSMIGMARDLAGYFGARCNTPIVRVMETMDRIDNYIKVTVENKKACPRYGARFIRGVHVGPSPDWVRYKLESAGVRAKNNIIDATNLVMLEMGHPIHAFDLDRVANRHIIIRDAREGETLEMLDGEELKLTSEDLLIADPREPIALAGVMGGMKSGIHNSTINVVIECACFDPVTIRKTARRLGMQTEASFRFERSVDPEGVTRVLDRVATLMRDIAGGEIVQGIMDVKSYRYEKKILPLSISKTNRILGTDLGPREMADLLLRLDFEITKTEEDNIHFSIPPHRTDIDREIDLVEEVARMYGYEKVKPTIPYLPAKSNTRSPVEQMKKKASSTLVSLGFNEMITLSFTSSRLIEALGLPLDHATPITNPISSDQDVMRTSLLPGVIEVASWNLNRDLLDLAQFEAGKVFRQIDENQFEEEMHLMAVLCGETLSSWRKKGREVDFYDIKGAAEAVLDALLLSDARLHEDVETPWLHPGRSARYIKNGKEICRIGEFHPVLTERLELKRRLYLMEMNLTLCAELEKKERKYTPIPKFPAVDRDLAVIVDKKVSAGDIQSAIKQAAGESLEDVSLFDLYTGDPVPEGKKSLAYAFTFRSTDRTLTDEEVNQAMENILAMLKERFNAILR